jgi:hypothetical protein
MRQKLLETLKKARNHARHWIPGGGVRANIRAGGVCTRVRISNLAPRVVQKDEWRASSDGSDGKSARRSLILVG